MSNGQQEAIAARYLTAAGQFATEPEVFPVFLAWMARMFPGDDLSPDTVRRMIAEAAVNHAGRILRADMTGDQSDPADAASLVVAANPRVRRRADELLRRARGG